jgi:hypothetical protein
MQMRVVGEGGRGALQSRGGAMPDRAAKLEAATHRQRFYETI